MVKSCSAYECTSHFFKNSNVSFHKFPLKDVDLLQKWVVATKCKNFTLTTNSYLCSKHFLADDFYYLDADKLQLKASVVPSVFAFPEPLQMKQSARKSPSKRNAEENVESLVSPKKPKITPTCDNDYLLDSSCPTLDSAPPYSLHLQRQDLEGKSRPYSKS